MLRGMSLEDLWRLRLAIKRLAVRLRLVEPRRVHLGVVQVATRAALRIPRDLVAQLGDGVLQPVELVAEHVELGLAEGHVARCGRGSAGDLVAVFGARHGNWGRGLLCVLALVGRVVGAELRVVSVAACLAGSREVASGGVAISAFVS